MTSMHGSGRGDMHKATTSIVLLVLIAGASAAFTQELRDQALLERELAITESIRLEELENGPYSEPLIELYTTLSFLYEEAGDSGLAYATIERALQVIRANYGLDSLEQEPSIRRLIAYEQERGDARAAWNLEQDLVEYAGKHRDDVRAARIYRDVAEGRMSVLRRYDAGEFPAEIVLGCYYDDTNAYGDLFRLGSRPITAMKDLDPIRAYEQSNIRRCHSGSQSTARKAILLEAQAFYAQAAALLLANGQSTRDELKDVLTTIVDVSYQYKTLSIGRQSLARLVAIAEDSTEGVRPRVEAMVQLADWDLMSAGIYGRIMVESALETYREAYALLRENGTDQRSIDAIFAPEMPVMLPGFVDNPLEPEEGAQSAGYIDVAFEIKMDGRADAIEVLQTTEEVTRAAERDLVRFIKRNRFRPHIVEGEFAESAPVTVRFYPKG